MAKVGGWVAGIVASIIVGYAVWYLTRTPPPPPPPTVTTFEGMVYSGSAPVPKAMVAVQLSGTAGVNGPVHDITDDNGAYRIDFTGLPADAGATLSVTAAGYQSANPKSFASPLQTDVQFDFPLTPMLAASRRKGAAPHPAKPAKAPIPKYVRKSAAQATQIKIPPK